jgi:lipoprotein-anchoring transpeptidase ErfK/SrfK
MTRSFTTARTRRPGSFHPPRKSPRFVLAMTLAACLTTAPVAVVMTAGPAQAQGESSTTTTAAPSAPGPTTLGAPSSTSAPSPSAAEATTSSPALTTAPPATTQPASTQPAPTQPATTKPSQNSSTTTTSTTVPGTVIPPGKVLKVGSKGPDVLALEQRLDELKIDTGKIDGRFDWSTWQGVVAFQKYWGLKRTGTVSNELRIAIARSGELSGFIFRGPATRLEVDKSKQLLFMYIDGELWRVVSVSTGSGKKYCEFSKKAQRQVCGTATTPNGRFKIQRRINGWRESNLGRLYNPLYFNGGIAFHGAPSVPTYPASHGCVRLPMPVAEWFPDMVDNGTAVYVYD